MKGRLANLVVYATAFAGLLAVVPPPSAETAQPPFGPLPALGPADSAATLMGAASTGESWAFRRLPGAIGAVRVGARSLAFGSAAGPSPEPQLAFLRHTDAAGWQVFDTPVDELGDPYRGPVPNRLSARITPAGGGVLVGRDLERPAAEQAVVLHHEPGGAWRAIGSPPPEVLLPAEGERAAESLAAGNGAGAIAVAAIDEAGRTGLLFGPQGRDFVDGIVHYDGSEWSREPIEIPVGSELRFRVLAVAAGGLGNAWAIAEPDQALGRSLVLLRRTSTPEGPLWVEQPLGPTPFADAETPGVGIAGVAPLGGAAQPLTVTGGRSLDRHRRRDRRGAPRRHRLL